MLPRFQDEVAELLGEYRISDQTNALVYLLNRVLIKEGIEVTLPDVDIATGYKRTEIFFAKQVHQFAIPAFNNISIEVLRKALEYLNQPVDAYQVGASIWLEEEYFAGVLFPKIKLMLADIAKHSPHDLLPFQLVSKPVFLEGLWIEINDLLMPVLEASLKINPEPHSLLDDAFNIVLQVSQLMKKIKGENKKINKFFEIECETQELSLDLIRKMEGLRLRLQEFIQHNPVFAISHPAHAAAMRNIDVALQKYARFNQNQALLASAEYEPKFKSMMKNLKENFEHIVMADILFRLAGIKPRENGLLSFTSNDDAPGYFRADVAGLNREECVALVDWVRAQGDQTAGFNGEYEKKLAEQGRGHYLSYQDGEFIGRLPMPEQYRLDVSSTILVNTLLPLVKQEIENGHADVVLARATEIKPAAHDDESESYDKNEEDVFGGDGEDSPDDLQKQVMARRNSGMMFSESAVLKKGFLKYVGTPDLVSIEKQRSSACKHGKSL